MKVMVLVKASPSSEAGVMPDEQLLREMGQFNEELVEAGIMEAGEGLHPSSRGVRVRFSGKDRTLTNGPFAETKELIAGFWIWKVKSMDEAVAWVKRCPNPHPEECEIEIRPLFTADDFGAALTPELREQEAAMRAQTLGLAAPRFEHGNALRIAGLNESYTMETRGNIPAHWNRFVPHLGKVPGQVGKLSYGVCWNFRSDCGFDYLTGVALNDQVALPAGFTEVRLPAQRYVVITHPGHVSTLPQTIDTIWQRWIPESGLTVGTSPAFERYTEDYDGRTGLGGMEIWIPIQD